MRISKVFSVSCATIAKEMVEKSQRRPGRGGFGLGQGVLAEPAFVGREPELQKLEQHLDRAFSSQGTAILISGEAGTGKTRLANEFLEVARKRGAQTICGWCLSNMTIPYFPFIEGFNDYLSRVQNTKIQVSASKQLGVTAWLRGPKSESVEGMGVTRWLKGPSGAQPLRRQEMSPEMTKDHTALAVGKTMKLISAEFPAILFIDDIQWADSASLSLFHYLSRLVVSYKLLILATYRVEELHPVSEGHPHPLVETLRLMSREGLFTEIKLGRLIMSDLAKLAESVVGGKVDNELATRLTAESQGNPLFAVETLRMLAASSNLVCVEGEWCLTTSGVGIPSKVRDIILRRLDVLDVNQRRILDLASVMGDRFSPELIASVLSRDRMEILETLNLIQQSALLINPADSQYGFSHAKIREVLTEVISPPLKKEYHTRIAEKLEALVENVDNPRFDELAYHYIEAGNKEKSVKFALLAGDSALREFSNSEAIRYFTHVLEAVSTNRHFDESWAVAMEGLGDAYYAMGLFTRAGSIYESLSESGLPETVKLRTLRKAMSCSFNKGDFPHALELEGEAGRCASVDPLEFARIQKLKAKVMGFTGKVREALTNTEQCLKVFETENSEIDVVETLTDMSKYYLTEFLTEQAKQYAEQAIDLSRKSHNLRGEMLAHFSAGEVYFHCGIKEETVQHYDIGVRIGESIGAYGLFLTFGAMYLGMMYEYFDELEDALSATLKALELSKKTESEFARCMVYSSLVRQYMKLANIEAAEKWFVEFMKLFANVSHTASRLGNAVGERTIGVFHATKGNFDEANKHFEESLQLMKTALFTSLFEAMTRTDYAKALLKQGRKPDARTQFEEAMKLYARVGNNPQVLRLKQVLAELENAKS
jgi:tetratricopeptide (TPR) repeat protein